MRPWKTILAVLTLVLLFSAVVSAQETEREKRRSINPTVIGATGLFTVYDSSTLKQGELNLGIFANNYDRDPGDVDIMQYPVNISVGVTNKFELFLNSDTYQRVISNAPYELSGPNFPGLFQPQGQFSAAGTKLNFPGIVDTTNPNFFPLTGAPVSGALVGGILPGLPQTGAPVQIFDQQLGINKPGYVFPGYLNDFPFLGRGGGTTGNVTFGGKYRFTSQDAKVGLAFLAYARVPTVAANALLIKERGGRLTMGSGAGATDFALFLIASPRTGIISTHFNFGFVHANDPESRGFKLLDRSDSIVAAGGIDIPLNQYVQLIGEGTFTYYIGDATSDLNRVNPGDVVVGARFYPFGKREDKRFFFSIGGGYRYFLNNSGSERRDADEGRLARVAATGLVDPGVLARSIDSDYNGFVAHVTLGLRKPVAKAAAPPMADPCAANRAPAVALTSDKLAVKERANETISLTAQGTDPENGNLTYTWSASGGQLSGSGDKMTWSSAGLAPGTYIIKVTVTDPCNNTAVDSRSLTVEKANRCPTVSLRANPTEAQEGADVTFTFTANGNDPDNDKLDYAWSTTRGTLSGGDASKQINSTGLSAGSITVTVKVSDGQCAATDSVTVNINPRPAKPNVFTTSCTGNPSYKTANSTRVDNACKRVLDDVAIKLQNDPNAIVILDGHSDKGEKPGTAKTRAERVRDYLVNDKRIDAARIEIRVFDNSRPDPSGDRTLNRRVVINVVPQGADRPQ